MTQPSLSGLQHLWPYAGRRWEGNLVEQVEQRLPCLGGGWTLRRRAGVLLEGTPIPLTGVFGRGGLVRVGDVVLRPYRRGGMVRYLNRSTYSGIQRFQQEFGVHARLYEDGFPTVEPLGYGFRRKGLGWQGVFFTRWLEAVPWPSDRPRSPRRAG